MNRIFAVAHCRARKAVTGAGYLVRYADDSISLGSASRSGRLIRMLHRAMCFVRANTATCLCKICAVQGPVSHSGENGVSNMLIHSFPRNPLSTYHGSTIYGGLLREHRCAASDESNARMKMREIGEGAVGGRDAMAISCRSQSTTRCAGGESNALTVTIQGGAH